MANAGGASGVALDVAACGALGAPVALGVALATTVVFASVAHAAHKITKSTCRIRMRRAA